MKHANRKSFLAALMAAALAGCAHTSAVKNGAAGSSGDLASGTTAEALKNEPDVRGDTMTAIAEVQTVRFDYDSAALNAGARAALKANAAWLKRHADVRVQVAGHCDERGTEEYNLALGQRRAAAVRGYYLRLGVSSRRIATISYGKERPLCRVSSEECWSRNRRAETLRASANSASRR